MCFWSVSKNSSSCLFTKANLSHACEVHTHGIDHMYINDISPISRDNNMGGLILLALANMYTMGRANSHKHTIYTIYTCTHTHTRTLTQRYAYTTLHTHAYFLTTCPRVFFVPVSHPPWETPTHLAKGWWVT